MKKLKELLSKKSLAKVVPALVALIIAVAGVYGVTIDADALSNLIMVIGGLLGTLIGIFMNPDKDDQDKGE